MAARVYGSPLTPKLQAEKAPRRDLQIPTNALVAAGGLNAQHLLPSRPLPCLSLSVNYSIYPASAGPTLVSHVPTPKPRLLQHVRGSHSVRGLVVVKL